MKCSARLLETFSENLELTEGLHSRLWRML